MEGYDWMQCIPDNASTSTIIIRLFLRFLYTVATARCSPANNTTKVQRSTANFVFDSRQILDSPAADQHNTMLLKIMALSLDISHDRLSVGQLDTSDFPLGRVGLFRCPNHDLGAYAFFLGTLFQKRRAGQCCPTWRRFFALHGLVHRG